jgi:hypothetical protein
MEHPIETKGLGKPDPINGNQEKPSEWIRLVFYDAERAAYLCCNLRVQVLADRPAQVV